MTDGLGRRLLGERRGLASTARLLWLGVLGLSSVLAFDIVSPRRSSGALWAADPTIQFNLLELPSSARAQVTLREESRFFFDQQPFRECLQELRQAYQIDFWIDRRLDPSQSVTLATRRTDEDSSLHERLQQMALLIGADVGLVENVVYFAPKGVVARTQRAAVQVHDALSRSSANKRATLRDWSWPDLSTPSEVVRQLERDWGIPIHAELPHDLWHGRNSLQPSTLATQLSLVLAGFEMEANWTPNARLRSQPLTSNIRWQANYGKQTLSNDEIKRLKARFPEGALAMRGGRSLLSGETDFHIHWLAPPTTSKRRDEPIAAHLESGRWAFQVENVPAESVIDKLANSIGFEVAWDAKCTPQMRQQLIRFQVNQVNLDQLLSEFARASELHVTRSGAQVEISPAK